MRGESKDPFKVTFGGRWWVPIFFLLGFALGQKLPDTFLRLPLATLELMRDLPLGSRVVPIAAGQLEGQSSRTSWGEYGVVIGYEKIKNADNEPILLCRIRTHEGSGPLLAVNPGWIRRVDKRGS